MFGLEKAWTSHTQPTPAQFSEETQVKIGQFYRTLKAFEEAEIRNYEKRMKFETTEDISFQTWYDKFKTIVSVVKYFEVKVNECHGGAVSSRISIRWSKTNNRCSKPDAPKINSFWDIVLVGTSYMKVEKKTLDRTLNPICDALPAETCVDKRTLKNFQFITFCNNL